MKAARILVVDDDLWIQRTSASVLGQQGHQVSLAGDAPSAFALASQHPAGRHRHHRLAAGARRLVLVGAAARAPACARTPIVFLLPPGDTPTEVAGVEPRDQRLRKPFRVEDLERTIVTVLGEQPVDTATSASAETPRPHQRSVDPHKPSAGHRPLSALRGELDQISLSSVLTVLEMERKNGILLVEHDREVGTAVPAQAAGSSAPTIDEPALSGAAAVYEMLTWGAGLVRLPGRRRRRRRRDPGLDDLPADRGRAPARRGEGRQQAARGARRKTSFDRRRRRRHRARHRRPGRVRRLAAGSFPQAAHRPDVAHAHPVDHRRADLVPRRPHRAAVVAGARRRDDPAAAARPRSSRRCRATSTSCSRTRACWSSTSPPGCRCTRPRSSGATRWSRCCASAIPDEQMEIAHRIDRETSGVLLIARDRAVASFLTRAFARRAVEKTYLALVKGHPPDEGRIDVPLRLLDTKSRVMMGPAPRRRVRAGRRDAVPRRPAAARTRAVRGAPADRTAAPDPRPLRQPSATRSWATSSTAPARRCSCAPARSR